MSDNRAEENEASYPDPSLVRDSRDGGSNESEEVEDGVGNGGPKLQVGAPLPKHWGHVIGNLCGASLVLGCVWQYQVLLDLISPWSRLQHVSLSTPGILPGHWSIWAIMAKVAPLLYQGRYLLMMSFFSSSFLQTIRSPFLPHGVFWGFSMACAMFSKQKYAKLTCISKHMWMAVCVVVPCSLCNFGSCMCSTC